MDNRLCIAVRAELVALLSQLLAEYLVVPNLSIEDDPDISSFVGHRLMSAVQVDDTKARKTEAYRAVEVSSAIIWSAM
jgi:hypothetical protein